MWCEGSKIFMVIVVKIKLHHDKMMIFISKKWAEIDKTDF